MEDGEDALRVVVFTVLLRMHIVLRPAMLCLIFICYMQCTVHTSQLTVHLNAGMSRVVCVLQVCGDYRRPCPGTAV